MTQGTIDKDLDTLFNKTDEGVCDNCGQPLSIHEPTDIIYCRNCGKTFTEEI